MTITEKPLSPSICEAIKLSYEEASENRDLTDRERYLINVALESVIGNLTMTEGASTFGHEALPEWVANDELRNPDHLPQAAREARKNKPAKAKAEKIDLSPQPVPTGTITVEDVREATRLAHEDVSHRSELTDAERPGIYEGISTLLVMFDDADEHAGSAQPFRQPRHRSHPAVAHPRPASLGPGHLSRP